ncbi:hypothetical protein JAAARDRAFT_62138 [Jaapia argillacea MUCL 33604]|uniref:Uncharacterized protein n=1 Tax=Jaapia argillacea MUCL 33604 TaxID=933084 RepID=A0A067PB45_9AGAM|nr:hypothetical protein JAAARDRAFT_62138 [Jaapia argillacea MUCL 33604]
MPGLKRTMITQWMKAHYRAFLGLGKETTVVGECGVALIESFTNEAPDKASIPSYDLSEGLARRVDRRLRKHGFSPSRDSSRGRSSRPRRRATSEVAASEAYSGTRRSYRRTVSEVAGIVGFGDAQESSFDFIPSRSRESSPRPDHLSSPLPIFTVYSPPPSLVKEDSRVNGTLPAPPQPQIESAPSPVGQSRVSMWKRPLRFFSRAMKVRKEPKSQPSDPPRGPSGSTAPTTADIPTSSTAPQSSGDAVRKEPKAQRSDWPRGRNRSTAPRTGTNGPVPSTTITRRDGSLAPSSSSRVTTLELEWE